VQAVFLLVDGMFLQERKRIAQLAASARLAAVYGFREHVDAGGLISYGVNLADNFRLAATYVVKILKGTQAGDLAVEFPNKPELIINLKTSKALGVDLSPILANDRFAPIVLKKSTNWPSVLVRRDRRAWARWCSSGVCTENLIRVDDMMESPKPAE
jgi:ABC-type uncharacterized transport system substrate-binding protein